MNRFFILFVVVFGCFSLRAQQVDTSKTFRSLQMAMLHPEQVVILDLSKQKLDEIPVEVFLFKNLKELYLGKNKIKKIPAEIGSLKELEIIDLSKNKLTEIPPELFNCVKIKRLILNQNLIVAIPREIQNLSQLTYLDMWSNELAEIPEEIANCKNLKEFDLRVIEMTKSEQDRLTKLLPDTKIHFSAYCNCSR